MTDARAPRLEPLDLSRLTPAQQEILDDIQSDPRRQFIGPHDAWFRSPGLAWPAQRMGAFCRFGTSLEPRLSELAILFVAERHKAQFEWFAHAPMAIAAGVPEAAVEDIRQGRAPRLTDPRAAIVAEVARALTADSRLDDSLYQRALETLGEQGLVELVGVIGYYVLVSYTLNVFEKPLPPGAEKPFADHS